VSVPNNTRRQIEAEYEPRTVSQTRQVMYCATRWSFSAGLEELNFLSVKWVNHLNCCSLCAVLVVHTTAATQDW